MKKWFKTLHTSPCYGFEIKERIFKYASGNLYSYFDNDKKRYKIKIIVEEINKTKEREGRK